MTLGALALLVGLAMFLVARFDATALERERTMVEKGFTRQIQQYGTSIVPQADWDKAVAKLDHTVDPEFADVNFGEQLFTFNGFTHTFIVDGTGQATYASAHGKRAPLSAYAPFAAITGDLLRPIRTAEMRRGRVRPNANHHGTVTRPIQTHAFARINGQAYIVIATLIQPDIGLVLPKGPRAPVAITAMPIGASLLNSFASRYLVDDLKLVGPAQMSDAKARFPLRSPDGAVIGALGWTPRQPGSALLKNLQWSLWGGFLLIGLVGWTIIRRSAVVVDELIASEVRAKHLAFHDPLTRLPNRAMLFERLPMLLAAIGPSRPMLAVLAIDLDRFKEVNDTLGHPAGDELIKAVAERLRDSRIGSFASFAARLGGDEFILICPAQDRASVEDLAQRCLARILQPVETEYGRIDVGCSVGVAIIEDGSVEPSRVLQQADLALYRSKADGRACVTLFEPAMEDAYHARHRLEGSLRAALVQGGFHMVYQPQMDAQGTMRAAEALLRWNHSEMGAIAPDTFIPLAEECGLILPIGEFVLRRVFEETRDWGNLRVAINVSAVQMRTPGFAARVVQLAARAGVDPARYEIEVTETALLADAPTTMENFEILKRLGFTIALDDFGTGYSSLSLLNRFSVDKIKIDRSFVAHLGKSEEAEALVVAIVKLARSFRIGVIAEGVETEAQRERLIAAGCGEFQGYLLGRPMAGEAIRALTAPQPAKLPLPRQQIA